MPSKEKKPRGAIKTFAKGSTKPKNKPKAGKGSKAAVKGGKGNKKPTTGKGNTKGKQPVQKLKAPKPKVNGSKFKHLFQKRTRNYSIGNDIQPRRDLTRFVRWPKYIRVQRQKRILMTRLKVPPAINQFTRLLDKKAVSSLYKFLNKYRPESPQEKKARLFKIATFRANKEETPARLKKPISVIHGAQQVTKAIENKKAKLAIFASDVDPIELVVALPALCRKLDVPYVIVNDKNRLGTVVRRKTTAAIAFIDTRKEDRQALANHIVIARDTFNNNVEHRRQWGGGKLGNKSLQAIGKRQRIIAKEKAAREKA